MPPKSDAATKETLERDVQVKTPEGVCDAVLVYPADKKPRPGIVLYPDAKGLRPTKVAMASRLAAHGYAVLATNQFYRARKAPVFPADFTMANPTYAAEAMKLFAMLNHDNVTEDAAAFVDFLDAQPEVDAKAKAGAVGFCMGGAMAIRTAAAKPDRIGAVASFHGGFLVTGDANSPHHLLAQTHAVFHIAIATNDDEKQPQDKVELRNALDAARLSATMEVYPGAMHGWMVPDTAPFNPVQAERGWQAMLATFDRLHAA
jgi:carboxymethylenebutenolidase